MREKIYLSSPHMCGKEMDYIQEAFDTNWIAPLGKNVDYFEREIAAYAGVKAAAALSSGTAAIHLALKACGVKQGDTVFCSDLTFAASCNPIIYEQAVPVFIDSERKSLNMSPAALEKAFKKQVPKAVIAVNLYGQSADMAAIKRICDKRNIPIIEDAAESLGATYKDKMSGSIGKFGVFSFNGNKIITTSGGGMLVSDDEEAIAKARFWATQARDQARHYQHSELGYNYRMSNIVAGIGRGQLTILSERIKQKKAIYEYYKNAFEEIGEIEMCPIASWGKPNYWLSIILLEPDSKIKPLDIMLALEKENIESRPVWKPMQVQPFYEHYEFFSDNSDAIAVSEDVFGRGVCLPSDTKMTEKDMARVCGIIKGLF